MEHTTMQTHRERPLGVSIIAVLEGLLSLFWLVIGVLVLIASFNVPANLPNSLSAYVSIVDLQVTHAAAILGIVGGILVIVGVLGLLSAWGLWRLKRFAFWSTMVILSLSLLNSILAFFRLNPNVVTILLGMVIPVIILVYFLVDANVRAAFPR